MNESDVTALRSTLLQFVSTATPTAAEHASTVLQFLATTAQLWHRATLSGHITASAWVLDRARTHAALIHHKKLNRWLQPGGHVDDTDATWHAAAERELIEETGLSAIVLQDAADALFDVDVHAIPARGDEPAHWHYDLRYLLIADVDASDHQRLYVNADEAHDCRWFSLASLADDPYTEPSIRRMASRSNAAANTT